MACGELQQGSGRLRGLMMSRMQGNLLDDTELIDVLATTKQTSQDVAEKLAGASETNAKINEACEEYRPVAHRATLVYFLVAEFSVVNCMYQTSLAQFTELYELAIDHSDKATMPSKRIANIIDYLTHEIYLYIQRGLFERHKLLFALMMANKILQSAGAIKAAEVDVFLKGGGALDIASVRKKPKDWIPDGVWLSIVALSQMDSFRDIPDSVFRNDGLWKQWCALRQTCCPRAAIVSARRWHVLNCPCCIPLAHADRRRAHAGTTRRRPRWQRCPSTKTA